jgi:hypothetical protein
MTGRLPSLAPNNRYMAVFVYQYLPQKKKAAQSFYNE